MGLLLTSSIAALTMVAMLIAILAYDRIVRWIYENRQEQWIALGRPTGCFFKPRDTTFWASYMSRSLLGFRLLVYPPACVREEDALAKQAWIFRAGLFCCLIGFVAVILVS
jgi:hypothetical protein